MRVLEGTNLLGAAELLLALTDLIEDLVALLIGLDQGLLLGELGKLLLDLISLGHGVEEAGQEGTLLTGNLGGGSVVGDGTVTDGPDVVSTVHNQVLVDSETTARVSLSGELAHQVTDNGADGVTGGPDEKTVGDGLHALGSIGVGNLGLDVLVGDVLDHGLGADSDGLLLEGRLGVVNQLLGEHGQDVGQSLDKGNVEVVLNLGNPLLEIVVEEILELTGELNTSGTTTNDNHVKQTLHLVVALVLEHSGLNAVHNTSTDVLGIVNLLQEARVLLHTGDTCIVLLDPSFTPREKWLRGRLTESSVLGTNTDNEHVERNLSLGDSTLDLRVVANVHNALLVVDLGGLGFVELDASLLLAEDVANGLHDRAVLDLAGGT